MMIGGILPSVLNESDTRGQKRPRSPIPSRAAPGPRGVCSSVAVTTSSTLSSRIDGGRPGRAASGSAEQRTGRPVGRPRHAQLPVAPGPPRGSDMGDLEPLRRPPQRPAILHDTPGQAQPPSLGSGALRWTTRTSRSFAVDVVIHTEPRRSPLFQDHSSRVAVTNDRPDLEGRLPGFPGRRVRAMILRPFKIICEIEPPTRPDPEVQLLADGSRGRATVLR